MNGNVKWGDDRPWCTKINDACRGIENQLSELAHLRRAFETLAQYDRADKLKFIDASIQTDLLAINKATTDELNRSCKEAQANTGVVLSVLLAGAELEKRSKK
jgi:hypothetical protein